MYGRFYQSHTHMSLLRVVLLCLSVASTVAAEDPCLVVAHAEENYATCCAHGNYKEDGRKEVCREAGLLLKGNKKKELR